MRPMVRREGFEPPAFWSVGCHKAKSEPFRLRFTRFSAIRSVDFPLFPSSLPLSNPILGQKWVKDVTASVQSEFFVCVESFN